MGSRDGAVVRALASHQCGSGSFLEPGVICGLSLLSVLFPAPRVFLRFSSLHINRHFQVPNRSGNSASLHVSLVSFTLHYLLAVKSKGILKFFIFFFHSEKAKFAFKMIECFNTNQKLKTPSNEERWKSWILPKLKRTFIKFTPEWMEAIARWNC